MEALKGLYHADKLDEQSFIDNFTIRLKEFKQIMDNLEQQKKKPLQHFLITGKRGMGKSTLLRRIFIEAEKAPLNEKIHAVRLGAEQYRLSRLFKLWELVIEQLSIKEPKLAEQKKALEESKQYEENLVHIINDYLTQTGKTLLLLIDNFDQFIDKIPTKDQHALREALMLYPVQIIGNTVFYNEHFKSYNNPFFDFFKPIHLGNLDKEEAEDFMKQRAKGEGIENFDEIFEKQKGKITTLRILSGGVPRTLLILLSIISKKNTGNAVDYLHEMIEQVTPLYQDRMKSLSPQQQEIMHHLAMHWDRTPVKELATEMRIPSKSISAQLVQLEDSGYINKVETNNRNHYYEIDERFFNIWLLMSEAPSYDTKRVIWLTKWLDAFYSNDELKDFALFCQSGLKDLKPGNRFLIAQALSESEKLDYGFKKQMVSETAEELKDIIADARIWAAEHNKKIFEPDKDLLKQIQNVYVLAESMEVLNEINLLEKINHPMWAFYRGYLSEQIGDIENAAEFYRIASEAGVTEAQARLGLIFLQYERNSDMAERYFIEAIKKGSVTAMTGLGTIYYVIRGNKSLGEEYFLMAADKNDPIAMSNLAAIYFTNTREDKKAKALELLKKGFGITEDKSTNQKCIYIIVLLWNEKISDAMQEAIILLSTPPYRGDRLSLATEVLKYFLIFKQKQILYKIFSSNNEWKDQYKPVYYALMNEMQDEYPKEYLKMTEELKEPVEAILEFVKNEQKRLGIN